MRRREFCRLGRVPVRQRDREVLGRIRVAEQLQPIGGGNQTEKGGSQGMAAESGRENPSLEVVPLPTRYAAVEALLRKTPYEFEFFQAVRLLERLHPQHAPVGRFVSPSREVVRFAAHASFPFPASQIQRIEWPQA